MKKIEFSIAERFGFSNRQWEKCWWLSAIEGGSFNIFARRKGDSRRKVWVGIYEPERRLGIIMPLTLSFDKWDKTLNDKRKEICQDMVNKYWEKYNNWEIIDYDNNK